ncbi:hypothetical protein Btru_012692 [Bulinus truncatus]|nr:hypothetical protein Btru_012692 [Bulinus truncatus]
MLAHQTFGCWLTRLWLLAHQTLVVGSQDFGCWFTRLWLLAHKTLVVGSPDFRRHSPDFLTLAHQIFWLLAHQTLYDERYEDYIIEKLWDLHKSPRYQVGPLLVSPRLAMYASDQVSGGPVSKNFRLKGYTSQYMMSPRQPMVAPVSEDRKKNEEKLKKYFGKPSMFELSSSENKDVQTNREPLALRKLEDIYSTKREDEIDRIRRERKDMEEEKQRMEDKRSREMQDKENERKQSFELNNFLWDQRSHGHGGPNLSGNNKRRQFVDKDSGPFYQEKREYESKPFQLYDSDRRSESQTPFELQEYSRRLNHVSEQKKLLKQQRENVYDHLGMIIDDQPREDNYRIQNNFESSRYPEEKRSLDLDHTRGGGGAPVKDDRGKSVTRRPITLSRDDYGETRIREDFNRLNADRELTDRELLYSTDNKPYFPWGGSGAGAPIRDREGKVITQIFGKLEGKTTQDDEYRKEKLRKEVLFNELREVEKQQKENKEELKRYMRAPQVEMTDLLAAGRVGKPRRDEVTGMIGQQHLGHSDVSKVKTNYQPKPVTEKRQYHDELVRMAEERQYQKLLDRFKDRQEANAHFQNMDSSWGQFGGGAPKHEVIRKKVNLTNALFYPDQASEQNSSRTTAARPAMEDPVEYPSVYSNHPATGLGSFEFMEQAHHNPGYQKRFVDDDQRQYHSPENSPRYLKNTINSSHKNLYQTTAESRVTGRSGQTVAPYATGIF